MSGGDGRMMGNLVNVARFGEHREPTPRESLLSEINKERKIGHWKHANDLKRHWIGFEINPEYHKIANNRINGITKKERDSGYQQTKLF
jgi:hypothetical protein